MYAVIFEVEPKPGQSETYFELAGQLRTELEAVDGFISVERFQSLSQDGKYLSLSLWRDASAVQAWRENLKHRQAQARGRGEIFARYRIMVADVVRDYSLDDRDQAPVGN